MSRIITTTVYTLDERSATAREQTRAWYREHTLNGNRSPSGYGPRAIRLTGKQYEWQTSNITTDDAISTAEYTFSGSGQRFS
jgi:hypothetical protein